MYQKDASNVQILKLFLGLPLARLELFITHVALILNVDSQLQLFSYFLAKLNLHTFCT